MSEETPSTETSETQPSEPTSPALEQTPPSTPTPPPVTSTSTAPPATSTSKTTTGFLKRNWRALLAILLALSIISVIFALSLALYQAKNKNKSLSQWLNTRNLLPIHTLITLQSVQNGKFLRMHAQEQVSATGEDPLNDESRWVIQLPDPSQMDSVQYSGVRLENVKHNHMLSEVKFPKATSSYMMPNVKGTVFYAALAEKDDVIILTNAENFETNPGPANLSNPFLFQVDPAGLIISLPHVAEGTSALWKLGQVGVS